MIRQPLPNNHPSSPSGDTSSSVLEARFPLTEPIRRPALIWGIYPRNTMETRVTETTYVPRHLREAVHEFLRLAAGEYRSRLLLDPACEKVVPYDGQPMAGLPGIQIIQGQHQTVVPVVDSNPPNPYRRAPHIKLIEALACARATRRMGRPAYKAISCPAIFAALLAGSNMEGVKDTIGFVGYNYSSWRTAAKAPAILSRLPRVNGEDVHGIALPWARGILATKSSAVVPELWVEAAQIDDDIGIIFEDSGAIEARLSPHILPMTILASLQGRTFKELVSHHALDAFDLEIVGVKQMKTWTRLMLRDNGGGSAQKVHAFEDPEAIRIIDEEMERLRTAGEWLGACYESSFGGNWRYQEHLTNADGSPYESNRLGHVLRNEHPVYGGTEIQKALPSMRPLVPIVSEEAEKALHQDDNHLIKVDGLGLMKDMVHEWPRRLDGAALPEDALGSITARDCGGHPAMGLGVRAAMMIRALHGWDAEASRCARRYLRRSAFSIALEELDAIRTWHRLDPAVVIVMALACDGIRTLDILTARPTPLILSVMRHDPANQLVTTFSRLPDMKIVRLAALDPELLEVA